jgi:hypothetical protein
MNEGYRPQRYYKVYGLSDEVTDAVESSDGKTHLVTMRGWHWDNLDWIDKYTSATQAEMVDGAIIGTYEVNKPLSGCLEAAIYFFIEAYHNARME